MSFSQHDTRLVVRQFEAGDESLSFVLRHLFEREQLGQIETLLVFLRRKFRLEEEIMRNHDYPSLREHQAAHGDLTERLIEFGAFARCGKMSPDSIGAFVRCETVEHVERFDMPLLDWLKTDREESMATPRRLS